MGKLVREIINITTNTNNNIQSDFYYSISSLTKIVENKLIQLLKKEESITAIQFVNKNLFVINLSGQINLYIKNNLLPFILTHEFNIAKEAGIINDNINPAQPFHQFIKITNNTEWIEYLFEKYPKLENRITLFIDNTLIFIQNLFSNLTNNWNQISAQFLNSHPVKILQINLFLGDLHKSNKNVCLLTFENNVKILYKPRNYNNENALNKFVDYLNSKNANIEVGIPKFLTFTSHSWVKFIEQKDVNSEEEITEYYNNLGKIVCLFYILGTADIIPDNIIVSGKMPYFIDLECLISKPKLFKISPNINGLFEDSVIRTGMLPLWVQGEGTERDILNSVFFEFNTQTVNKRIWENKNSSQIQLTKSETLLGDEKDKHLPSFNGKVYSLTPNLLNEVKKGFKKMYSFFSDNKDDIVKEIQSKSFFQNIENRIILHPTAIYETFFREINLPEYFQNTTTIDELLHEALKLENQEDETKLFESLKKQLYHNDIPYFYVKGTDNALYDGFGEIIDENFEFNNNEAINLIIQRLKNLNKEDFRFQSNIVDCSLQFGFEAFKIKFVNNDCFINSKNKKINNVHIKENLLLSAVKIAEFLIDNSFCIENEINWISKNRDQRDGRYAIMPMNLDLYDGISGIAFFFLYLYKYSKEEKYNDYANKIFKHLENIAKQRLEIDFYNTLPEYLIKSIPLAPFSYPCSYIYLSTHFHGNNFNEIFYKDIIYEKILNNIYQIIDINTQNDFFFGKIGLLNFLITLKFHHNINNRTINQLIESCILNIKQTAISRKEGVAWEYIDSFDYNAKKYLGGFAHGTGGIASVLFRSGKMLKDVKLTSLAKKALSYDRSLFDEKINGWIDGRTKDANYDAGCWCHGSSGIALSRLLITQFINDEFIPKELEIAATNILLNGIGGNQCVCHGDLGNLEVLYAISKKLKDNELKKNVLDTINNISSQFLDGKKLKSGDDGQLGLYSLFMGYAGMGYQFIRFYDWENTPSILCLESSCLENKVLH